MNLASEQDQSSIAQQNLTIKQTNKYLSFNDMQILQSRIPTSMSVHQNCKPFSMSWNINNGNDGQLSVIEGSGQQYINKCAYSCCLDVRLKVEFKLKKRGRVQIYKFDGKGESMEQKGVKYEIQNGVSVIRIKTSITSKKQTKIWKQIQMPIMSYEPQSTHTLLLVQKANGDIYLTLDDFEFMMNYNVSQLQPKYFAFRGDAVLHNFTFEQLSHHHDNLGGCGSAQCSIF